MRPMLRILFRADGGPSIGDGHLMRCLALAQHVLDSGGACGLVTTDIAARPIGDWKAEKVTVAALAGEMASAADVKATVLAATNMQANFVVVDGYAFKADYFAELAREGFPSLRFADTCEAGLKADIVINQNAGAQEWCRTLQDGQALLGCDYAMLRRTLRAVPERSAEGRAHILFTLGGYDPDNLAPAIAAEILKQAEHVTATLVCAGGPQDSRAAEQWSRQYGVRVEVIPPGNIDRQMTRADLAVCAGGTTSLELASLGVPMVIVIRADNQRAAAHALEKAGCAVVAGEGREAVANAAKKAGELLADRPRRLRMGESGRLLVDGRGVERVAAVMLERRKNDRKEN